MEVFMNLKECYKKLGGDYDEVLTDRKSVV